MREHRADTSTVLGFMVVGDELRPAAVPADASLAALAGHLRTSRIATFDRHVRSLTTDRGEAFVLLPEDA